MQKVDFKFVVTTLGLQGVISLGCIQDPSLRAKNKNLSKAKLILSTLLILREKTKGNLTADESDHLQKVISELKANVDKN